MSTRNVCLIKTTVKFVYRIWQLDILYYDLLIILKDYNNENFSKLSCHTLLLSELISLNFVYILYAEYSDI